MNSSAENQNRKFLDVNHAFRSGDLIALKAALDHPADFPNCLMPHPLGIGDYPIDYAIFWSPISFIIELIEMGAEINRTADDGFPCLFTALSSDRVDRLRVLELLLANGADIGQRGINDWTALHYAVMQRDLPAVEILLENGADTNAATGIDDCTSPLEDAQATGFTDAVALMSRYGGPTSGGA